MTQKPDRLVSGEKEGLGVAEKGQGGEGLPGGDYWRPRNGGGRGWGRHNCFRIELLLASVTIFRPGAGRKRRPAVPQKEEGKYHDSREVGRKRNKGEKTLLPRKQEIWILKGGAKKKEFLLGRSKKRKGKSYQQRS